MSTGSDQLSFGPTGRLRPLARCWPLLLAAAALWPWPAQADAPCYRLDGDIALQPLPGCHQLAAAPLQVSDAARASLQFDTHGLAAVQAGGQHHYLHRDGHQLAVLTYDNGPDGFAHGLVRARVDGRIAYYNRQLQPAFAARFDWGFPFENGLARVCNGCQPGPADADGHSAIGGGEHFCINLQGQTVDCPH